jgi:parallel beta-helix repeat protein
MRILKILSILLAGILIASGFVLIIPENDKNDNFTKEQENISLDKTKINDMESNSKSNHLVGDVDNSQEIEEITEMINFYDLQSSEELQEFNKKSGETSTSDLHAIKEPYIDYSLEKDAEDKLRNQAEEKPTSDINLLNQNEELLSQRTPRRGTRSGGTEPLEGERKIVSDDEIAIKITGYNDFWAMNRVGTSWNHLGPNNGGSNNHDFDANSGYEGAGHVVSGDFDGDYSDEIGIRIPNYNDFWVMQYSSSSWSHLGPNNGGSNNHDFDANSGYEGADKVVTGDFDGDFSDEIAISIPDYNDFWVMQYSSGSWSHLGPNNGGSNNYDFDANSGYEGAARVVAGDFDGDHKDEIAINTNQWNDFWVMQYESSTWGHLGPNNIGSANADFDPNSGYSVGPVITGDFDGDHKDEIALNIYGYNDYWVMQYENSAWSHLGTHDGGSNNFDFDANNGYDQSTRAVAGDFDGDGKDEIAINIYGYNDFWVMQYESGVWSHLGDHDGGGNKHDFDPNDGYESIGMVLAGDFDCDGKDEIAINIYGYNDFWVMEYENGAWSHLGTHNGGSNNFDFDANNGYEDSTLIVSGDFDGDGIILGNPTILDQGSTVKDVHCIINAVPQQQGLNFDTDKNKAQYGTSTMTTKSISYTQITDWAISASASWSFFGILDAKMEAKYKEKFTTSDTHTSSVNVGYHYWTIKNDVAIYTARNYKICKYPIISTTDPNDYLIINCPTSTVIKDDLSPSQISGYSPFMSHTLGKVDTYTDYANVPSTVNQIYQGTQTSHTMSDSVGFSCYLTHSESDQNLRSSQITKSLSGGVGAFGVNLGLTYTTDEITTEVSKFTTDVSLSVVCNPDSVIDSSDKQYTVYPFFYWNNGALVIDFAVSDIGNYYLAPTNDLVTPPSGGISYAMSQTYTFTTKHSDPQGYADIKYAEFLINSNTDKTNCFYGRYDGEYNLFKLRNDANTAWIDASSGASNSYVTLESGSSASGTGDTLTVTWKIKFKWNWDDETCNLYIYSKDDTNRYDDWEDKGNWVTENDLIIYSVIVADNTLNPGQQLSVTGTVTYEGTTNKNPSDTDWHVHLYFDGSLRDETDNSEEGDTDGIFTLNDYSIPNPKARGDITDGYVRVDNDGKGGSSDHNEEIGTITINNIAPTVTVTSPNGGEIWKDTKTVTWTANDNNGDSLTYTLKYSDDNGGNWYSIDNGITQTSYNWDTTTAGMGFGFDFLIKVIASDGLLTGQDTSDLKFELDNPPNTVWIDDDYTSSSCGGHVWDKNAFDTIEEGINAVSDGGTVYVNEGTYTTTSPPGSDFIIDKPLTLEATGSIINTIVNCGGNLGHGFKITVSSVTINGFTIKKNDLGSSDAAIYVYNIDGCTITNNKIGWNTIGIFIEDSSNVVIQNNEILYNEDGIYLKNSNDITIGGDQIGNDIHDNKEDGIYLDNSNSNTIYENDIYDNDNGPSSPGNGIHLYSSQQNYIELNIIYNSVNGHQEYGIILEFADNNFIQNVNDIDDQEEHGIFIYQSDSILIKNNDVSNNDVNGIFVSISNGNTISGNTLADNGENGIRIFYCSFHTLTDNIISNNDEHGILLDMSTNIILTSNQMTNCGIMIMNPSDPNPDGTSISYWNTHTIDTTNLVNNNPVYYWTQTKNGQTLDGSGGINVGEVILAGCTDVTIKNINGGTLNGGSVSILLGYTTNCLIDNNQCDNNNMYGICLWTNNENAGDPTKTISNNICNNNGEVGIYLHDNNDNLIIDHNDIDGNSVSGYGILLEDNNDYNTIKRNLVIKNSYGILIMSVDSDPNYQSNDNILHNNHVLQNWEIGIKIEKSYNNIIRNNLIKDNSWYGVHIDGGSDNNQVFYNDFIDNNGNPSSGSPQAYSDGIGNIWDDGSSIGNYWSDAPGGPYAIAGFGGYMDNYGAQQPFNNSRN